MFIFVGSSLSIAIHCSESKDISLVLSLYTTGEIYDLNNRQSHIQQERDQRGPLSCSA